MAIDNTKIKLTDYDLYYGQNFDKKKLLATYTYNTSKSAKWNRKHAKELLKSLGMSGYNAKTMATDIIGRVVAADNGIGTNKDKLWVNNRSNQYHSNGNGGIERNKNNWGNVGKVALATLLGGPVAGGIVGVMLDWKINNGSGTWTPGAIPTSTVKLNFGDAHKDYLSTNYGKNFLMFWNKLTPEQRAKLDINNNGDFEWSELTPLISGEEADKGAFGIQSLTTQRSRTDLGDLSALSGLESLEGWYSGTKSQSTKTELPQLKQSKTTTTEVTPKVKQEKTEVVVSPDPVDDWENKPGYRSNHRWVKANGFSGDGTFVVNGQYVDNNGTWFSLDGTYVKPNGETGTFTVTNGIPLLIRNKSVKTYDELEAEAAAKEASDKKRKNDEKISLNADVWSDMVLGHKGFWGTQWTNNMSENKVTSVSTRGGVTMYNNGRAKVKIKGKDVMTDYRKRNGSVLEYYNPTTKLWTVIRKNGGSLSANLISRHYLK